jgi:metal-dependent amidase/aminoacylase/carboxypeptidase family protein
MSLSDVANSWLAAHNDDLVGWRRHIHRYPELGRQEYATTQFVAERLVEAAQPEGATRRDRADLRLRP